MATKRSKGTTHRLWLMLALLAILGSLRAQSVPPVWLLEVTGPIGPATSDYIARGLSEARQAQVQLVVLRLDTPGGLDQSMRAIIREVLDSPVPVATYVAPRGARAASAGTYILYASHIAAMAPATNLGAATPVQIGSPSTPTPGGGQDGEQPNSPSAMEKKIVNDAAAYIRSLAELRGRNAEWAEQAVREGASLAAKAALEKNVIDLMARDVDALLTQLDGREVSVGQQTVTLRTADAAVEVHEPDWRNEFLSVITDPNVAYILMLLGIYGLIFEFSNPGLGLPGILGAVCLLVALYAFQILPISYAGLGLILLGMGLMIAEAFAPSFGVLGLGGVAAFIIGSIILMDTELPAYQIALPVILALAVVSAGVLILVVSVALRSARQKAVSGLQHLVGQQAVVETLRGDHPMVRLEGELWQVDAGQPLAVNDRVVITDAGGVTLKAQKQQED